MPNFWTRATQAIQEAMNGPRTKDIEFTKLLDKMRSIETGVLTLRAILQTFESYTQSLGTLFQQLSESIDKIYDDSSPFHAIATDIKQAHVDMISDYNVFKKQTSLLSSKTTEWSALFTQVQEQLKHREEKRKVYDHYEQKLDKLYESTAKRKTKSKKEEDLIERNEQKYKTAAEEYAEVSEKSFKFISNILDRRYDMINPVCIELVKNELKFFKNIAITLGKFDKLEDMFKKMQVDVDVDGEYKYDPWKSIKGRDYIRKGSVRKNREMSKKITEMQIGDLMGVSGGVGKDEEIVRVSFPRPMKEVFVEFDKIKDELNSSYDDDNNNNNGL